MVKSMQTQPLYGLQSHEHGRSHSCQAGGEFCFLCEFESQSDGDAYASVVDLVEWLTRATRRLARSSGVHRLYNDSVRQLVTFKERRQEEIQAPDWSYSNIRRHILHSNQFPAVARGGQAHAPRLVVNQNNSLIDAETGVPIEDRRKALLESIKALEELGETLRGSAAEEDVVGSGDRGHQRGDGHWPGTRPCRWGSRGG